jgi:hypothetical protein
VDSFNAARRLNDTGDRYLRVAAAIIVAGENLLATPREPMSQTICVQRPST